MKTITRVGKSLLPILSHFKKSLLPLFLILSLFTIYGQSVENYFPEDGLITGGIYTIIQDQNQDLWFGSWTSNEGAPGLGKFDGTNWQTISTADGLVGDQVRVVFEDRSSNIWIGTTTGISKWDGTNFTNYTSADGLVGDYVFSINQDSFGNMWFGTRDGISKFDGSNWTNYDSSINPSLVNVCVILEADNGDFWFGTTFDGALKFDGSTWTNYNTLNGLGDDQVYGIIQDENNDLWFGGYTDGGISRFDGTSWTVYDTADGISNTRVRAIHQDNFGDIWFGHNSGVTRYDGSNWTNFDSGDGLIEGGVRAIMSDSNDNLWIGNWLSGVSNFKIGEVNIPDPNFEQALIDMGIDSDEIINASVLPNDVKNIEVLEVPNRNISSLEGLWAFSNLKILRAWDNQLTSLDVSSNSQLVHLSVARNQITSLDLTNNTALIELYAYENNLGSLIIPPNDQLKHMAVHNNHLTTLDLTGSSALLDMNVSENNLSEVILGSHPDLLNIHAGGNSINTLDVSNIPSLRLFLVWGNNLSEIDFTNNPLLEGIDLNLNNLSRLDLSNNHNLKFVLCNSNKLEYLNIANGNNVGMESPEWSEYSLDASNNTGLRCINVDPAMEGTTRPDWRVNPGVLFSGDCSNLPTVYIPDENFEQALIDQGIDSDGIINQSILEVDAEITSWLELSNSGNGYGIQDLTGIEYFINLVGINCNKNPVEILDFSYNSNLEYVYANECAIKTVNVSNNAKLINLHLWSNQISELDVSNNSFLKELIIESNQLTSLDLSNNSNLTMAFCAWNKLSSLNIANGNNANFTPPDWTDISLTADGNPGLSCIKVDEGIAENPPSDWRVGYQTGYSTDCNSYVPDLTWGIVGSATPNGWEGPDIPLEYDATTNTWSTSTSLESGEIKFRYGNDWSLNYGDGEWETRILDGVLDRDGANIPVASGQYDITINLNTYEYTLTRQINENPSSIAGKWIIAPEAGSLKVGPTPGSDDWWFLAESEIQNRICYMDDLFEFSEDGSFKNVMGDETILEPFQGVETQICGEPVYPHDGSIPATYDYDPVNGTITINGRGSFLGISSAVNGGVLPNVPIPESIDYDVTFSDNGNIMNVSLDWGDGFWTYKLIKDAVFIPDSNFEQALIDIGVDSDGIINRQILRSDAEAVTELNLRNPVDYPRGGGNEAIENVSGDISDLTGIKSFINLEKLFADYNALTEIDISKNSLLTFLSVDHNFLPEIDISENTLLESVYIRNNQLTEFDFSNPQLKTVYITNNQISNLDLSNGQQLIKLVASENPISEIDVSSLSNLEVLAIANTNVSSIDVNENSNLKQLSINNLNIQEIDLSNNILLERLFADNSSFPKLDLSKNVELIQLNLLRNQLHILDLSNNTKLLFPLVGNSPNLEHLDLRNGNNLNMWYVDFTNTPNLTCINADAEISQAMINSGKNFSEDCGDFIYIPDPNFEQALIDLGVDSDGVVNTSVLRKDVENITSLNMNFPKLPNGEINSFADPRLNITEKIEDLTGIEAFVNLHNLQVGYGLLTDLDLSANTQLEELFLNDNQLNSVDVSMLPNLKRFGIMRNNMTSGINVSSNPLLEELFIHNTGITSIDLSANSNLWNLFIASNELTSLDLSANINLKYLFAQYNQLTDLDLSANTALIEVRCQTNQLPQLDITNLTVLERLDAYNNPGFDLITGADGNPSLRSMNLSATGLSNFNGAAYPNLEWLLLNDNNLSNFNGNNNLNLQNLFLNNNTITKLGLTGNAQLVRLEVMNNGMEELDLRNGNNSILGNMKASGNMFTCISVDDPADTTMPYGDWELDLGVQLSLNCKQAEEVILIPDANFEQALIDLGLDTNGGEDLTGNILLSEAESITSLDVSGKNITDATGIEGFVNLTDLDISDNLLTEINLLENSALVSLDVSGNGLTELFISSGKNLMDLQAENNALKQLNFAELIGLQALDISGNSFDSIILNDLSNLVSVDVSENALTELDLRNGNNSLMELMNAANNPLLECIGVDDETSIPVGWNKDTEANYTNSGDCDAPVVITKNITVYLDRYGFAEITPTNIDNGSYDNVTEQKNLVLELDILQFTCDNLGKNDVILLVTDESGNFDNKIAIVNVIDEIAPEASSLKTITLDLNGAASVQLDPNDINYGSSDNCGDIEFSVDQSSFSFPGDYTVEFTVLDTSGNTSSTMVDVEVVDSQSNTTSLKFKGNLEVIVYPNPFSTYFKLAFTKPVDLSTVEAKVFTLDPRELAGVEFKETTNNELIAENLVLSQAEYILTVTINGETQSTIISNRIGAQ